MQQGKGCASHRPHSVSVPSGCTAKPVMQSSSVPITYRNRPSGDSEHPRPKVPFSTVTLWIYVSVPAPASSAKARTSLTPRM